MLIVFSTLPSLVESESGLKDIRVKGTTSREDKVINVDMKFEFQSAKIF